MSATKNIKVGSEREIEAVKVNDIKVLNVKYIEAVNERDVEAVNERDIEAVNERDIKAVNERNIHRFSSDVSLSWLALTWIDFLFPLKSITELLLFLPMNVINLHLLHLFIPIFSLAT